MEHSITKKFRIATDYSTKALESSQTLTLTGEFSHLDIHLMNKVLGEQVKVNVYGDGLLEDILHKVDVQKRLDISELVIRNLVQTNLEKTTENGRVQIVEMIAVLNDTIEDVKNVLEEV